MGEASGAGIWEVLQLFYASLNLLGGLRGDIPAFVESVRSYVWPKYEKELGKEIFDAIMAAE